MFSNTISKRKGRAKPVNAIHNKNEYIYVIPMNFVKLTKQSQQGIIHQAAFTCSLLTIETLEDRVKYVRS